MFGLFGKTKKDFQARIQPSGDSVEVKAGDNLLKAGLAAGLRWPHDCRVGSCGNCRCRLVEGKIKPLSDFSYVLDGEQLNNGMILACQSQLKSDVVIDVELEVDDGEAVSIGNSAAVLSSTRMLTHDIMELTITTEQPLQANGRLYKAGQYADITFPGIAQPRSYSFAATEDDNDKCRLSFYVRHVPNGELTDWLFDDDRTGSALTVSGPYGSFWLRDGNGPIVCIAGGSGMSAIKAILEQALADECPRDVVYLFGARTQADLYCIEDMQALSSEWNSGRSMRFVPVLSEEPQDSDWSGLRGLVTEHIAAQLQDWSAAQAYLCGPPGMIDAAVDILKQQGVSEGDIHFDKFLDAASMPGGR